MRPVVPNLSEPVAHRRLRRIAVFLLVMTPTGACGAWAYSPSQRPGLAKLIAGSR